MKPYCICFAGAIGSSKTPIAHYLSLKLGLPIHNNDVIRTEVKEDFGELREGEYEKRRDQRIGEFIQNQRPFILDASVDRTWTRLKTSLIEHGFDYFMISMDLSKERLAELYEAKSYHESRKVLDQYVADHDKFLADFSGDIGLHLADEDFPERLPKSFQAVEAWLRKTA
ncbi:hypothetical protein M0Q28_01565 [Patescibacteria group bacterium]|jgi:hypothetical protein|nr:hypothetical protein [Patescibacteria group bacterium]